MRKKVIGIRGIIGSIASLFGAAMAVESPGFEKQRIKVPEPELIPRGVDIMDFNTPIRKHNVMAHGKKLFCIEGQMLTSYSLKAAKRKYDRYQAALKNN